MSETYTITGTVLKIFPEQTFPSGFSKREFVVTTHDRFPQSIKLEFTKEKCDQLDDYQPGDPVRVSFNLLGNEYDNRHFVSLRAWKIVPESVTAAPMSSSRNQPVPAAHQTSFYGEEEDPDDVPF